jgi:predicted dehydrogenase
VRVALVGAGGMARSYREVYAALPGVEWALVVDVNPEVQEKCRELGAQRTSDRFEDALAEDIDLVDISTPNHLHAEQTIAALEAGKHVLLQKPMANTLEAADRIVLAAERSRGVLGMYMSSFANPLVWEIRRLVQAGALGEIQSIRARDAHRGGLRARDPQTNWRGSREKTGGGSFIQLSVHAINLMQWWIDSPIVEVSAFSDNRFCPNIGGDDVATAIVRFESRVLGVFDSGYASNGNSREIYGTRGSLRLLSSDRLLELVLDGPYQTELIDYLTPKQPLTVPAPPHSLGDASSPINPQRMFIERIRAGEPPLMSARAGRQDLAVVMAAYLSAESGQAVRVAPAP